MSGSCLFDLVCPPALVTRCLAHQAAAKSLLVSVSAEGVHANVLTEKRSSQYDNHNTFNSISNSNSDNDDSKSNRSLFFEISKSPSAQRKYRTCRTLAAFSTSPLSKLRLMGHIHGNLPLLGKAIQGRNGYLRQTNSNNNNNNTANGNNKDNNDNSNNHSCKAKRSKRHAPCPLRRSGAGFLECRNGRSRRHQEPRLVELTFL